jgi:hypothetical protein
MVGAKTKLLREYSRKIKDMMLRKREVSAI